MVTASLLTSSILKPFLVFTGVKVENSTRPRQTNDWKYKNGSGKWTGPSSIHFQEKHWFDNIITIRYLDFLCDELFPGKLVGLIWDFAPSHASATVEAHIKKLQAEGKLIVAFVPKGLTSVMQVCDLIANKDLKRFTKEFYYQWRTTFLTDERARLIQAGNAGGKITVKVPYKAMIQLIEDAVNKFNNIQRNSEKPSIRSSFRDSGQDPWFDKSEELFIAHLDRLRKQSSMYLQFDELIENQTVLDLDLLSTLTFDDNIAPNGNIIASI